MPNRSSNDWQRYAASVTPFQRRVFAAVRHIRRGQTRSYGWVAQQISQPGAARAVGQALNKNSRTDLVPCHRVVASDGTLGGYAWGIRAKRRRLTSEGAHIRA